MLAAAARPPRPLWQDAIRPSMLRVTVCLGLLALCHAFTTFPSVFKLSVADVANMLMEDDGMLTMKTATARAERMDANGDGFITSAELEAVMPKPQQEEKEDRLSHGPQTVVCRQLQAEGSKDPKKRRLHRRLCGGGGGGSSSSSSTSGGGGGSSTSSSSSSSSSSSRPASSRSNIWNTWNNLCLAYFRSLPTFYRGALAC